MCQLEDPHHCSCSVCPRITRYNTAVVQEMRCFGGFAKSVAHAVMGLRMPQQSDERERMLLLQRLYPLGELFWQVSLSPGLGRGKGGETTRGASGERMSHAFSHFLGLAGMLTSANQCLVPR